MNDAKVAKFGILRYVFKIQKRMNSVFFKKVSSK